MSSAFRRTTFSSDAFTGVVGSSYTKQASGAATYLSTGVARVFPQHRDRYDPDDSQGMNINITAVSGNDITFTITGNPVDGLTREIKNGYWILMDPAAMFVVTTAAELQAAVGSNRWLVVPPGLGDLTLTAVISLSGINNFRLDIGDGSAVVTAANTSGFTASGSSATNSVLTISTGTAFNGTLTEYNGTGTLASGDESLAEGDYAMICKSGNPWQVLKVKGVSGSAISFYSGFAAAFTVAGSWKLHKFTPTCTNIRISGTIKQGSGTSSASVGVSIKGGVNIDLTGLKTEGFTGHANDCAVYLYGCYNVNLDEYYDHNSGDANLPALYVEGSSKVAGSHVFIETPGHFPFTFVLVTDYDLVQPRTGTGGRSYKIDTCYRGKLFGPSSEQSGVSGGTGIHIHSTASLGAPFEGDHLDIFSPEIHYANSYGLVVSNAFDDVNVWGGSFANNNIVTTDKDILCNGTGRVYLHDVDYSTITISGADVYIDKGVKTSVTPVAVRQSAALQTITVTKAEWWRHGKTIFFDYQLQVADATGAVGNNIIEIDLPTLTVNGFASAPIIDGVGSLYDNSAGFVYPAILQASTTSGRFWMLPSAVAGAAPLYLGQTGAGFAAALAVDDIIRCSGRYDVA